MNEALDVQRRRAVLAATACLVPLGAPENVENHRAIFPLNLMPGKLSATFHFALRHCGNLH
jgi:hypothetical protein